jgi:hypothetical protein
VSPEKTGAALLKNIASNRKINNLTASNKTE